MSDAWSGRGDPEQGDIYNDRSSGGGPQPRRSEPRPKLKNRVPMEAFPGESEMYERTGPSGWDPDEPPPGNV